VAVPFALLVPPVQTLSFLKRITMYEAEVAIRIKAWALLDLLDLDLALSIPANRIKAESSLWTWMRPCTLRTVQLFKVLDPLLAVLAIPLGRTLQLAQILDVWRPLLALAMALLLRPDLVLLMFRSPSALDTDLGGQICLRSGRLKTMGRNLKDSESSLEDSGGFWCGIGWVRSCFRG
jgi:hypothetical protein